MSPKSDTAINTAWLVFDLTGQWSLFALLLTFAFVKHLPQRNNPFLINFLLTTFLGTIPPAFLFYSGHLSTKKPPSTGLCFAQAAIVDGIPPMFSAAQVILVFDTWSELRSLCLNKRRISRISGVKYTLMTTPYIFGWLWVFVSFIAAAQSKATHDPGFVYCKNNSGSSDSVRNYVTMFTLVLLMIELALGLCVGWLLYRYPAKRQKDAVAWRSVVHFAIRITTLTLLQIIALILSVGNAAPGGFNNYPVKVAYELMTSLNPLAAFIAFATQRTVLQAWKIIKQKKSASEWTGGSQLPEYSLEWINAGHEPQQQSNSQVFDEAFEHEQGRAVDGYFKPWLDFGQPAALAKR